jgi:hypothetical protein
MASFYQIPFSGLPESFSISIVGVTYFFAIRFNNRYQAWVLDIYDVSHILLVGGIPLVTGTNLLAQYDYLGFAFALIVQSIDTTNEESVMPLQDILDRTPGWGDLNNTSFVYAVT